MHHKRQSIWQEDTWNWIQMIMETCLPMFMRLKHLNLSMIQMEQTKENLDFQENYCRFTTNTIPNLSFSKKCIIILDFLLKMKNNSEVISLHKTLFITNWTKLFWRAALFHSGLLSITSQELWDQSGAEFSLWHTSQLILKW